MANQVVVVGAGVIGLTCANILAEKGYNVTVIAEYWPSSPLTPEYTSAWAGAHFRPFPSKSKQEKVEAAYSRKTYEHFKQLVHTHPESSAKFIWGVDLVENASDLYKNISEGYSEGLDDFEIIDPSEFHGNGCNFGAKYKAWAVNPPIYLKFLADQLAVKGVKFQKKKLDSLNQVFESFPHCTIVNASGMGLQLNGGLDPQCYPIRGQTLLTRPKSNYYDDKTITHQGADGNWTFIISRPMDGGVIVGGTKQVNKRDSAPRDQDTTAILNRAKTLFPEIFAEGDLKIERINVGFRPARNGGVRVEVEKAGSNRVIHAYGLGGSGYEMSYGVGLKVLSLLEGKSKL